MEPNYERPAASPGGAGPPALDEPLRIGNYELFRVLGEGGAATTYLGRELETGALVAVKALQLLRDKHRHHLALFEREALALRALAHPQIPTFFATLVREGAETFTLYLVQEFIAGRSLAKMLEEGQVFSDAEVVDILLSCLEPLAYLHGQAPPLYHRDIKPSNIIRRTDGRCVLIDFGAVREALADPKDAGSSVIGTFGYMAPEQFQGRVNAATDLYSLGATALHLLSGRSPKSFDVRRLKPDFHGSVSIDPHLAAILDLLLEPVDEDRYQSTASLRRALERWRAEHFHLTAASGSLLAHAPATASASAAPPDVGAAPSVVSSVTRSPIIFVSEPSGAPLPNREERSAGRAQDDRDTPRALEAVGNQAMLLPAIRTPGGSDDDDLDPAFADPTDSTSPESSALTPGEDPPRASTGPTRRAPTGYPGTVQPQEAARGDVVIRRTRDPWWRLLYPAAPGYTQLGFFFLALALTLVILWRVRGLGALLPIVAALLTTFGLSYFVFHRRRAQRASAAGLLGNTDGRLLRVDLNTTALGDRYVTVHYEFRVEDRRYLGQRSFPSRDEAQPFLASSLPKRVWYDEQNPERSTLDH
jgi:serine/threonine protein kinase